MEVSAGSATLMARTPTDHGEGNQMLCLLVQIRSNTNLRSRSSDLLKCTTQVLFMFSTSITSVCNSRLSRFVVFVEYSCSCSGFAISSYWLSVVHDLRLFFLKCKINWSCCLTCLHCNRLQLISSAVFAAAGLESIDNLCQIPFQFQSC